MINKSFEEFTQRVSECKIHYLELRLTKYHLIAASSYIALHEKLHDIKAMLYIKNGTTSAWCGACCHLN